MDKVSEDSEGFVLLQLATLWKKLLKIHDYAFLVCGEPSTGLDIGSGLSRVITYKWLGTSGEYIASPPKILRYGKRSARIALSNQEDYNFKQSGLPAGFFFPARQNQISLLKMAASASASTSTNAKRWLLPADYRRLKL